MYIGIAHGPTQNMMRLWGKRWFRISAWAVGIVLVLLALFCWYFRIYSVDSVQSYTEMLDGEHPIWKDLALRRINSGDSAAMIRRQHQPCVTWEYEHILSLMYHSRYRNESDGLPFTGLDVVTRDGKAVAAQYYSCCFRHTFFGEETDFQVRPETHGQLLRITFWSRDGRRLSETVHNPDGSRVLTCYTPDGRVKSTERLDNPRDE